MEAATFVTFIIPSINRASLNRTLLSLTAQTDEHWKAVVAFDGITPDTSTLVCDKRVSFMFLERKLGSAKAVMGQAGLVRNYAIQHTDTAEWLAFVDDDDTVDSNYVKTLKQQAGMNASDCFIFSMTDGRVVFPPLDCTEFKLNAVGISFAYKRKLFDEGFQFCNSTCEDYILLHTMRQRNVPITIVHEVMYYVRGIPPPS